MESFKEGDGELSEDILRLLQYLMSREESERAAFDRVNVNGSNVGAVMNIHKSIPKELPDNCCINIYVSNNVQGVNNSILVGSEVKMGEPGLGISFGDVNWKRDRKKANLSTSLHRKFGLKAVYLCVVVLVFSLLLALFNSDVKKMERIHAVTNEVFK